MYLFKVEWSVIVPYTNNIVEDMEFFIVKDADEAISFKRNSLISAGYEAISVRASFVPCFIIKDGKVVELRDTIK